MKTPNPAPRHVGMIAALATWIGTALPAASPATAADTTLSHLFSFGPSATPPLRNPRGLAIGADGSVFVADSGNARIAKFTRDGRFLESWGRPGAGAREFNNPVGVALDSAGNLYVADQGNHRIQKLDPQGQYLTRWASPSPTAVTVGAGDRIHVADKGIKGFRLTAAGYPIEDSFPAVRVFNTAGVLQTEFALDTAPFAVPVNSGGSGSYSSTGLAVDRGGNVFVGYRYFYKNPWSGWAGSWSGSGVERFNRDGTYGSYWPEYPSPALAIDSANTLWAVLENNTVKRYGRDGSVLTEWGGPGNNPGQFSAPQGIAVDPITTQVYVADTGNHRIQVFAAVATLSIQPWTHGRLLLTWPAAATGYVPQQAVNPGPANWTNIPGTFTPVDGQNRMIVTPASDHVLYRLHQP